MKCGGLNRGTLKRFSLITTRRFLPPHALRTLQKILEAVQPKVTQTMNSSLIKEFHVGEVHKALKQMYILKAPSPDGMPPIFFQNFWPIVGSLVSKTILDFLNHGITPPKFNETHIVLVPKTMSPKNVTEYRPVRLCNVIYKLASKTAKKKNFLLSLVIPKVPL